MTGVPRFTILRNTVLRHQTPVSCCDRKVSPDSRRHGVHERPHHAWRLGYALGRESKLHPKWDCPFIILEYSTDKDVYQLAPVRPENGEKPMLNANGYCTQQFKWFFCAFSIIMD